MALAATNYDSLATSDDGSCVVDSPPPSPPLPASPPPPSPLPLSPPPPSPPPPRAGRSDGPAASPPPVLQPPAGASPPPPPPLEPQLPQSEPPPPGVSKVSNRRIVPAVQLVIQFSLLISPMNLPPGVPPPAPLPSPPEPWPARPPHVPPQAPPEAPPPPEGKPAAPLNVLFGLSFCAFAVVCGCWMGGLWYRRRRRNEQGRKLRDSVRRPLSEQQRTIHQVHRARTGLSTPLGAPLPPPAPVLRDSRKIGQRYLTFTTEI